MSHVDDAVAEGVGRNALTGVITDSSFTGVSTQYLVRMPWGQELMVFAPNVEHDPRLRPGAQVVLSWNPAHTFGLEATGDVHAGLEEELFEPASASAGS